MTASVTKNQVMAFIKLTPFQKERMMQNDPSLYQKLKSEMEKQFPKEDASMASEKFVQSDDEDDDE